MHNDADTRYSEGGSLLLGAHAMHSERYSSAEEAANAITHGIGLLLSIGGGFP